MSLPPGLTVRPPKPKEASEEDFEEKSRAWQKLLAKKYAERKPSTAVSTKKPAEAKAAALEMPVEHLRKIVKDHGDFSSRKFR
jgi:pre-mRNA-processing factor 8